MSEPQIPPVVPASGRIVRLEEADYLYGIGPIDFRIAEVCARVIRDDTPWILLKGYKIYSNGTVGPLRTITARLGGIKTAPILRPEE